MVKALGKRGCIMSDTTKFKVFPSDGEWKINRNDEFVGVFSSRERAVEAATGYCEEIHKNGGTAAIDIVEPEGSIQP